MCVCVVSLFVCEDLLVWSDYCYDSLSWWVELDCFRLDWLRTCLFFLFSFVWLCNIYEWFWLWLKWNGILNSRGKSDIMMYFFTFLKRNKMIVFVCVCGVVSLNVGVILAMTLSLSWWGELACFRLNSLRTCSFFSVFCSWF